MARHEPEETVEVHRATTAPPRLCLVVTPAEGASLVVTLPERGVIGVGRDPQADLRIESGSLSRLHFAVEVQGPRVEVRDVGSRNGTSVDGVAITDLPVPLALGSEVLAGDVRFALVRRSDGVDLATLRATAELDRGASELRADAPADVPPAFRYPSLLAVHADLRRVAPRAISLLVLGETGTGKEVVAREIHRLSGRPGPLIAVNAAALPETLIESELFGHERGAFSGAVAAKVGLIEASDRGTLFLDEIGELPLSMQAKLLRVLEERTVRRVGANTERKVDLRVVAATHQDLAAMARERRFRSDLHFRLNGATIELPPLRARRAEILDLARSLLGSVVPVAPAIDAAAADVLVRYDWPGNVRELKQVLERALAFAEDGPIRLEHLPRALTSRAVAHAAASPLAAPSAPGTSVLRGAGAPSPDAATSTPGDVRASVKDFERERIVAALRETGGNRTRAAELLGLPRRTLVYKLSKMRIDES